MRPFDLLTERRLQEVREARAADIAKHVPPFVEPPRLCERHAELVGILGDRIPPAPLATWEVQTRPDTWVALCADCKTDLLNIARRYGARLPARAIK